MAQEDEHIYPGAYEKDAQISDLSWKKRLADLCHPLLFAQKHKQFVGMIGARSISPLIAQIVSLYVIPAERRKGIASLLLESILQKIKTVGMIKTQLRVNIFAKPAIRLYERFDFEIVGKIVNSTSESIYEEFLMERQLLKQ